MSGPSQEPALKPEERIPVPDTSLAQVALIMMESGTPEQKAEAEAWFRGLPSNWDQRSARTVPPAAAPVTGDRETAGVEREHDETLRLIEDTAAHALNGRQALRAIRRHADEALGDATPPSGGGDHAGGEWQSISSAPHDGSHILLAFGQDVTAEGWWDGAEGDQTRPWKFVDTGGPGATAQGFLNASVEGGGGPSHWRRLPSYSPNARATAAPASGVEPRETDEEFLARCARGDHDAPGGRRYRGPAASPKAQGSDVGLSREELAKLVDPGAYNAKGQVQWMHRALSALEVADRILAASRTGQKGAGE